jgi:hypothetical protein
MNPENDHNYFSALTNVRLSVGEKSRMRALLRAHVAANPPSWSPAALFFRHALGTSLAAALLLVGGTSVLAHRSMPDDFLYPLKLAVSDRVSQVVASDEDAKLDAEISQVARMLRDEEHAAVDEFDDEERDERSESTRRDERDDQGDERGSAAKNEDADDEENEGIENRSERASEVLNDAGAAELRALDAELRSIGKDIEQVEEDQLEED